MTIFIPTKTFLAWIEISFLFDGYLLLFRTVAKLIQSTGRPPKPTVNELPMKPSKPLVHARPLDAHIMTRSMTVSSTESPHIPQSDSTNEFLQSKPSMTASLYSTSVSGKNVDEQKDTTNSVASAPPPVTARSGRAGLGTRVLPAPNAHGDGPTVTLRHFQAEKKSKQCPRISKSFLFYSSSS